MKIISHFGTPLRPPQQASLSPQLRKCHRTHQEVSPSFRSKTPRLVQSLVSRGGLLLLLWVQPSTLPLSWAEGAAYPASSFLSPSPLPLTPLAQDSLPPAELCGQATHCHWIKRDHLPLIDVTVFLRTPPHAARFSAFEQNLLLAELVLDHPGEQNQAQPPLPGARTAPTLSLRHTLGQQVQVAARSEGVAIRVRTLADQGPALLETLAQALGQVGPDAALSWRESAFHQKISELQDALKLSIEEKFELFSHQLFWSTRESGWQTPERGLALHWPTFHEFTELADFMLKPDQITLLLALPFAGQELPLDTSPLQAPQTLTWLANKTLLEQQLKSTWTRRCPRHSSQPSAQQPAHRSARHLPLPLPLLLPGQNSKAKSVLQQDGVASPLPAGLALRLDKIFENLDPDAAAPLLQPPQPLTLQVRLTWPVSQLQPEDEPLFLLADALLGEAPQSLLPQKIQTEQALSFFLHTKRLWQILPRQLLPGPARFEAQWSIDALTSPEKLPALLQALLGELRRLQTQPVVLPEDFAATQRYVQGRLLLLTGSPHLLLNWQLEGLFSGLKQDSPSRLQAALSALQKGDVERFFKRALPQTPPRILIHWVTGSPKADLELNSLLQKNRISYQTVY